MPSTVSSTEDTKKGKKQGACPEVHILMGEKQANSCVDLTVWMGGNLKKRTLAVGRRPGKSSCRRWDLSQGKSRNGGEEGEVKKYVAKLMHEKEKGKDIIWGAFRNHRNELAWPRAGVRGLIVTPQEMEEEASRHATHGHPEPRVTRVRAKGEAYPQLAGS